MKQIIKGFFSLLMLFSLKAEAIGMDPADKPLDDDI
jgi:hypothetical protein